MGITLSSGSSSINGDVNVVQSTPTPAAAQSVIATNVSTNGSNQNGYTVPANKKFSLMGVYSAGGGGNTACSVFKSDGTSRVYGARAVANTGFGMSSTCPLWVYAAAENVVVNMTTGHDLVITGILEDA